MARRPKAVPIVRRKPTQRRAEITVTFILEAAAAVLRSVGRAGFNTNRLAERAGVSIGTVYGYFPNKDAIFIALARRIIEQDAQALMEVLDQGHGPATLRHLIRLLLKRHDDDRAFRRTVISLYIAEGYGAEHDGHVETIIRTLISRPGLLVGREILPITPLRLFVASRAIMGIARSLIEQGDVQRFALQEIEDETVHLIQKYVLDGLS